MKTNQSSVHRSRTPRAPAFLSSTLCALTFYTLATSAQTWQTVDDYQYVAGQAACNQGLTVARSGVVYACGYASDGASVTPWHGLVMASADGGEPRAASLDHSPHLWQA